MYTMYLLSLAFLNILEWITYQDVVFFKGEKVEEVVFPLGFPMANGNIPLSAAFVTFFTAIV